MNDDDIIAAIATAPGRSGIGVIRISGPGLDALIRAIIGQLPAPRRAVVRDFRDACGQVIDQGIALYFPAPHSYTGQDMLELHGHGGPVVLQMLLRRCLELGARAAQPGWAGKTAYNRGQILYPRYELMEQVVSVFRRSGQSVPIFVDRHLSHSLAKARAMAGWAVAGGAALVGLSVGLAPHGLQWYPSLPNPLAAPVALRPLLPVVGGIGLVVFAGQAGDTFFNDLWAYDPQANAYTLRSYLATGQSGDFTLTLVEGGVSWTREVPGGRIRNTARFTANEWHEIGEFSRNGTTWAQVMELRLQREP